MTDTIFQIQKNHYLDPKLIDEKPLTKIEIDFTTILNERRKLYSDHLFIITQDNHIKMMDSFLFNFIKADYDKKNFHFHIKENLPKNIYWIDIQSTKSNNIHLEILENIEITLVHEEIITEKASNKLIVDNKGLLKYYHIVNSFISQLYEKENIFNNYSSLNLYFLQQQQESKIKINTKVNLFKNSNFYSNSFILTQSKQLRDDCLEIEHYDENTHSHSHYLALNNGKSVSQINNVVHKKAINSELSQKIKHILLSESGQSFSKPNLMIHCPTIASHGNTIGTFPEEWLFYLQQKGINQKNAQDIIKQSIIYDFCSSTAYEKQFYEYLTSI